MQKIFVEDDGNGLESMICKESNMKTNHYHIKISTNDFMSFRKNKQTGKVDIQLDSCEVECTVQECKEIIKMLKKCILE